MDREYRKVWFNEMCAMAVKRKSEPKIERTIVDIEDEKMWREGRQTDQSNNQDFIYLDVESGFATSSVDYELVVTYVDVGTATWSIEYPQSDCLISVKRCKTRILEK